MWGEKSKKGKRQKRQGWDQLGPGSCSLGPLSAASPAPPLSPFVFRVPKGLPGCREAAGTDSESLLCTEHGLIFP